jgi:hypothetical protein
MAFYEFDLVIGRQGLTFFWGSFLGVMKTKLSNLPWLSRTLAL